MWFGFVVAAIVCVLSLYVPGYCLFRILRLPHILSLVLSPLASIPLYCILGIVNSALGVASSFATVIALPGAILALGAIAFAMYRRIRPSSKAASELAVWDSKRNAVALCLYIAAGIAVGVGLWASSLESPDSLIQTYDNIFHYGLLRSFSDSGDWSLLSSTVYPTSSDMPAPYDQPAYYPAGWHLIAAALMNGLGVSEGTAANALNFVIASVLFPVSAAGLMLAIFQRRCIGVVYFGAVACVAVAAFPWMFLLYWPLFPNTMSLAVFPALCACFIEFFRGRLCLGEILPLLLSLLLGIVAAACLQPNSVFSAVVFLAPYCLWRIWFYDSGAASRSRQVPASRRSPRRPRSLRRLRRSLRLAACLAFAVFVAVVWIALYASPYLSGVVSFFWDPILTADQAVAGVATMSFVNLSPQPLIAFFVFMGIAYTVAFQRKSAWLVVSFCFSGLLYVVAASGEDTLLKHVLTGFWYTDPYRLAALTGILAMPLVAAGMHACVRAFMWAALHMSGVRAKQHASAWSAALVASVTVLFVFFPTVPFGEASADRAFDDLKYLAVLQNSSAAADPYSSEEAAFVEDAFDALPKGAVVINQPFDGSAYAYGISGANVYYRRGFVYGRSNETDASTLIREQLDEVASDEDVQEACRAAGAYYFMELGIDDVDLTFFTKYNESLWSGINSIDDDTEGFEVVLERGDMRLYRITAL